MEIMETLPKPYSEWSLQELFDRAVGGVIEQGGPSLGAEMKGCVAECLYRGENGACCAVGWLIPEDLYKPTFEGSRLDELLVDLPFKKVQVRLIGRLQYAHDDVGSTLGLDYLDSFKEKCIGIAEEFNLNTNVIK